MKHKSRGFLFEGLLGAFNTVTHVVNHLTEHVIRKSVFTTDHVFLLWRGEKIRLIFYTNYTQIKIQYL